MASEYCHAVEQIIEQAQRARVLRICNVGYDLVSSQKAVNASIKHQGVWAAVGIHPNEVAKHQLSDLATIKKLAMLPQVVAIGEIGLDLYHHPEQLALQQSWFIKQLHIAQQNNLPVNIHCRDAYQQCYDILQRQRVQRGIMHCFLGTPAQARRFLRLGFYISFSGVVTFKNATNLTATIKAVPLNRLLVETDAPYLAPEPNRGQINYPQYIRYTLAHIARVKQVDLEALVRITTKNACAAYQLEI